MVAFYYILCDSFVVEPVDLHSEIHILVLHSMCIANSLNPTRLSWYFGTFLQVSIDPSCREKV